MASLPISLLPSPLFPSQLRRPNPYPKRTHWLRKGLRPIRSCHKSLAPLYDDGYKNPPGFVDYIEAAGDLVKFDGDGGPPRWFCPVDCGSPVKDAPLLLFLPGINGIGLGLFMHHKALGRIFEVRCMHVPFSDRTPFEGLVKFIEDVIAFEHTIAPTKPIYLIGHSFGGCLALSVAARNPYMDLILVLSNPATSFGKSELQPLLPILRSFSYGLDIVFPFLLRFSIENQITKLASTQNKHLFLETFKKLSESIVTLPPYIQNFEDSILKETVSWKLKLLKTAASYCNSRLHAVKAEVLLLASCLDSILPNRDEAERLGKSLLNSEVYYFKDHGHNLLLENGIHLSSIIKVSGVYRHARLHNCILDYLPPTMTEMEALDRGFRNIYLATDPVMFSTLEDGKLVRGLSGIPNEGPVLLVGNHMLLGLDMYSLVIEYLREKRVVLHGLGHPSLFPKRTGGSWEGPGISDLVKLFGAVPVSSRNLYSLLSEKSHALLYPGGALEALHKKGEEYKLFWPVQPEFVRMATQFGATIVPFGTVGEDDLLEMLLDYNDLVRVPFIRDKIKESNEEFVLRTGVFGEVRNQEVSVPYVLPKIPGRFYYLFGKPIHTRRKTNVLSDREAAQTLYLQIKSEVERNISYLLNKRKDDMYRSIFTRILYQATTWGLSHETTPPTFEP